jgi:DNA-binding winged helix-turn-helix (wHTH) protein/tetratricopeptide (TPR) repeat protein
MAAQTDLQFDGWTVNRVSGELSRDGRSARLPQQPLRILLELFDHAGDIVTREQLVKALWPAGIVDFDNGLNVAVRKLRVALDDVGDTPKYIETLPKVGYRFIGKPGGRDTSTAPPAEPARRPRTRLVLVLTFAALAAAITVGWWWAAKTPPYKPSARALELYLEGIHNRSRRDVDGYLIAQEKFEAALREDPDYPQAWTALSESFSVAVIRQMIPPAEGVPRARAAVQRALELDDDLAEPHVSLGQIHLDHDRDFAAADREFNRAFALNDRSARLWHHRAMWHAHLGQVEESLAALRRARELEPMTLLFAGHYGLVLYNARRYDEAAAFLEPLVAANPRFDQARSALARAQISTGDLAGAEETLRLVSNPGVDQGDLGYLYARMGRHDEAMREIERLEARGREGFGVAYDQAAIYTALGDLDRGCERLARAVDDHSLLLGWMRLDPRMDPLRGRKCFAEVEKRVYGGFQ